MRLRRRHAVTMTTVLLAATLVPVAPSFATEPVPPETVHVTMETLPESGSAATDARSTGAVQAEVAFSMLGLRLPDGIDAASVRTRSLDGSWSSWHELGVDEPGIDGPDLGTEEATAASSNLTEPVWVGDADAFEVVLDGDPSQVEATLIDTSGLNEGSVQKVIRLLKPRQVVAPAGAATRPAVISRAEWGADESWRNGSPRYASEVRFGVVHHTAGSNSYSKAQSASVVRGIYSYHTRTHGWADIGYNVLIDKYGQVFEGRRGGLESGVIGAHAAGFNTGSFGVSVMGNYDTVDIPDVAFDTLVQVVAWQYRVHGIDASAGRQVTVKGRTMPTLVGHRDVGSTACPGRYIASKMDTLRQRVQQLVPASVAPPPRFVDVPASHAHFAGIQDLAVHAIVNGCAADRFCPAGNVTRAQLATFLTGAFDLPPAPGIPFGDVSGTHAAAIGAVALAGITEGCGPSTYCPRDAVTRGQMARMLQRALDLPDVPAPHPDVQGHTHAGAIGAIAQAEIAAGFPDGSFRPNAAVTRAQVATFVSRARPR